MRKVKNVRIKTVFNVLEALGPVAAEELYEYILLKKTMLPVSIFVNLTEKALKRAYVNLEIAKKPIGGNDFSEIVNNISVRIKYVEKLLKKYG